MKVFFLAARRQEVFIITSIKRWKTVVGGGKCANVVVFPFQIFQMFSEMR